MIPRPRRNPRPSLESMEPRRLLSAQAVAATSAIVDSIAATRTPSLSGTVQGGYTFGSMNPDAGQVYHFSGGGHIGRFGPARFSGQFNTPGYIDSGHAAGSLVLSNLHGSVTLSLTGPTAPGFSGPPSSFTYAVVAGSGAFRALQASGTVTVGLAQTSTTPPTTLQHLGSGRITLTFS